MKEVFKIAIFFFCVKAIATAQEESLQSLVNIVSLIPGEAPCQISLDGENLVPKGLEAGRETGWFYFPAGTVELSVGTQELKTQSGSLKLEAGYGKVVVLFLEPSIQSNEDEEPRPPKIRMQSFPGFEGKAYSLKVVSLCNVENYFKLGPARILLRPQQIFDMPNWTGSAFEVAQDGELVNRIEKASGKGCYYLFIGHGKTEGEFFAAKANGDLLRDNRIPRPK